MTPTKPPMQITDATAAGGKTSPTLVKRFADHHWCAAAATLTIATALHNDGAYGANMVGTMSSAATSMAVFRPRLTDHPCRISELENAPPAIEPTSAKR